MLCERRSGLREALALQAPGRDNHLGARRQAADFLGDDCFLRSGALVGLPFENIQFLLAVTPTAQLALSFASSHSFFLGCAFFYENACEQRMIRPARQAEFLSGGSIRVNAVKPATPRCVPYL